MRPVIPQTMANRAEEEAEKRGFTNAGEFIRYCVQKELDGEEEEEGGR